MELSHNLLKPPFELLLNIFRIAQKHIEKEINFIIKNLGEFETRVGPNGTIKTIETVVKTIDKLLARLNDLKKKVNKKNFSFIFFFFVFIFIFFFKVTRIKF